MSTTEVLADPRTVLAAGVLTWREKKGRIEVLLVHRPRYDDWSIPKGKLDPGETFPAAAVREVEEETGYRVRLHRPLPSSSYVLASGRPKLVRYWSGEVRSRVGPGPQNPREVDEVRWVEIEKAGRLMHGQNDQAPLAALRDHLEQDAARTRPIIIQRHAAALSRAKWREGEETRPLNTKGKRQAKLLPAMLDSYDPAVLISSPWERCRSTVQPFGRLSGLDLTTKSALTEAGHEAQPSRTAAVIARVLQEARPTVVCTHRPVLPTVIGVIRDHASEEVAAELPAEDPYLAAGEALVLHVTEQGRVVALERHRPILD